MNKGLYYPIFDTGIWQKCSYTDWAICRFIWLLYDQFWFFSSAWTFCSHKMCPGSVNMAICKCGQNLKSDSDRYLVLTQLKVLVSLPVVCFKIWSRQLKCLHYYSNIWKYIAVALKVYIQFLKGIIYLYYQVN